MRIEVHQGADDTGALEKFTWDLFPLVDASETTHLDESGLPKVGSRINPGMIIVGKIARTRSYNPEGQPTALEIQGLDLQTLRASYGHMWQDRSVYADETKSGVVREAFFEPRNGSTVAVVQIEKDAPGRKSRGRKAAAR